MNLKNARKKKKRIFFPCIEQAHNHLTETHNHNFDIIFFFDVFFFLCLFALTDIRWHTQSNNYFSVDYCFSLSPFFCQWFCFRSIRQCCCDWQLKSLIWSLVLKLSDQMCQFEVEIIVNLIEIISISLLPLAIDFIMFLSQ